MARYRLKTDIGRDKKGYVPIARQDGRAAIMGRSGCRYFYEPSEFPQLFEKIAPETKVSYVQVKTVPEGTTVYEDCFIELSRGGTLLHIEPPFTVHGGPVRVFERREEQVGE